MNEEDVKLRRALEESARKLDEAAAPTPSFGSFRLLAGNAMAEEQRRQKRQFALFVAVALAVVAALILFIGWFEVFFYALQGAATAGALAAMAWTLWPRPKRGSNNA